MTFSFTPLQLEDIILIQPEVFHDSRGFFQEFYKYSSFSTYGLTVNFEQDNYSVSGKDVLRGLHYQKNPKPQGKLIQVLKGTIFDVAVDIRRESKTFKSWISAELSEHNHKMIYIPPGFAHGFMCLSDEAIVLYKCTEEYSPEHEAGIRWDDPGIGITWPHRHPVLSVKDMNYPLLHDAILF